MQKQSKLVLITLAVGALMLVVFSLKTPKDRELAGRTKIRLQLQWLPQAQFAGIYVAEAKDFYAEEGLAIELSHGGPDINPIQRLVTQQSDIALATGDQVLIWQSSHQNETVSLKAVGTVFNRNISAFMSRQGQNLATPQALRGKRVGVYPSYDTENILLCLLKLHGVSAAEVEIKAFPSLQEFLSGKSTAVDVFPSYLINEPLLAEQSGLKVDVIDPETFGVQFYSDTVITTGAYLAQNRDIVRRFLRASARGWDYARANPSEALQLMYRVVGPSIGKGEPEKHQERMLRRCTDFLGVGPEKRVFEMEKSRWEAMNKLLFEIGRVKGKDIYIEACDFKMVDEVYSKK